MNVSIVCCNSSLNFRKNKVHIVTIIIILVIIIVILVSVLVTIIVIALAVSIIETCVCVGWLWFCNPMRLSTKPDLKWGLISW